MITNEIILFIFIVSNIPRLSKDHTTHNAALGTLSLVCGTFLLRIQKRFFPPTHPSWGVRPTSHPLAVVVFDLFFVVLGDCTAFFNTLPHAVIAPPPP